MRAARLKATLAWSAAPPDWAAGLRAATATIVPLAVGEASGRPQLLWVALGGWLATFADPGGPYPLRARTLLGYAVASAISIAAGTLCAAHPWLGVPVLFLWAAVSSLLRVYGEAAGGVGSLSLIAFCIALGTRVPGLQQLALRSALFAAGALWSSALALALWPVHPYRPVRRAVAACHRALALHARRLGAGPGWFEAAARSRGAIRAQLEAARAVVGSVRRARRGDSRRAELLVALYEAAELALGDLSALAETLQSLDERGVPRPAFLVPALERAAHAFEVIADATGEAPAEVPELQARFTPSEGELVAPLRALLSHLQLALGAAQALHRGEAAPGLARAAPFAPTRRSIRDVLSPRSLELRHALRVGATAAAAALLAVLLHRARGYWIILTAVIVLQPHGGATLRKGLQRVAGTVAGASIAALLAPLFHGQLRAALVLFVLAVAAATLRRHNYAVYVALMTPLFVLLAESTTGDWHLARLRVTSTLLGGAVALAGSYALWPQRERDRLPALLGEVLQATRALLAGALRGEPLVPARRQVGLALANADAAFERFLDEAHDEAEAEALMAVRSQARRLVGAIVALSAQGRLAPDLAAGAVHIDRVLAALTTAARERRAPEPLPPLRGASQGERLARPVEVIHAALARLAAA